MFIIIFEGKSFRINAIQKTIVMNFNHLYHLHIIAEEGSLAGAAQRLSLSSSTLSEQLKKIEDFFGTPLFKRSGHGLRLNESGHILHHFTTEMCRVYGRILSFFDLPPSHGAAAPVEIGICEGVGEILPEKLHRYLFSGKEKLSIQTAHREILFQQMRQYLLDIVFEFKPEGGHEESPFQRRVIVPVDLVVLCHPAQKEAVMLKIKRANRVPLFVLSLFKPFAEIIMRELNHSEIWPECIHSLGCISEVERVLAISESIALLPAHSLGKEFSQTPLISLEGPPIRVGEVCLITNRTKSPAILENMSETFAENLADSHQIGE